MSGGDGRFEIVFVFILVDLHGHEAENGTGWEGMEVRCGWVDYW